MQGDAFCKKAFPHAQLLKFKRGQSDVAQGKTHRTRFAAGSVRLLSALEKEAAAGGEPAAEKGGRVLMVIRFCSKEEVLGGSVMPPLGVGDRTEICSQ